MVGPMPEAGSRRAVSGPAEASGLRVDSALIDAIVADVHAADTGPGGAVLPLLSQALALTWENREGDWLGREGYDRAGRVAHSVEVSAEDAYTRLPEDQQPVARDMLRRMTAAGPDRRPVRRRVSRAELCAGRQKNQVGAVIDAFARKRLLVLDADAVEIAHDVLMQAWPQLRDWLEEDQASLILYGQLAEDTAPRRARRSRLPTRSPPRCSPGPHGGSHRPRRRVTACSSHSPSRCAAPWPPSRAW